MLGGSTRTWWGTSCAGFEATAGQTTGKAFNEACIPPVRTVA